jgi:hypothetical protein
LHVPIGGISFLRIEGLLMAKKGKKKNSIRSITAELMELEEALAIGDFPVRCAAVTGASGGFGTGAAWNSLLCYSLAFIRVKPWNFVIEEPNFFFESPFYPEPCVGNIMGQGGQSFGLVVFPSEKIWDRYIEASSFFGLGDEDVDPAYELTLSCTWLSIDFVSWRDLSPEGRTLVGQTTWDAKTANGLFPDILSYRAGYAPRIPDIGEVILLDRAVRAALLMAAAIEANQIAELDMMHTIKFNERFTLDLVEKEELRLDKVVELLPSQDPVMPIPPMSPDLDSVDVSDFDLAPYQIKSGVIWELAVERMGVAKIVDPKTGAVTIPRMVVALDSESHFAFPPEVITSDTNPVPAVLKVVMSAAQTAECLPEAIHVRDEKLCDVLVPLMGEYGVASILVNSLSSVDSLLEGIKQGLSHEDEDTSVM